MSETKMSDIRWKLTQVISDFQNIRWNETVNYLVAPDIFACQCWLIPGPQEVLCGDGGWPALCLQALGQLDATPLHDTEKFNIR